MRNAGLDEAQAGLKIAKKNINNLRYADDTTLMTERKEERKSLLMKVKEESEKIGLQLNKYKTRNCKTPRGKYRQNTFWHKSQQDPLWPTSQSNGNKSKNKQMGPN